MNSEQKTNLLIFSGIFGIATAVGIGVFLVSRRINQPTLDSTPTSQTVQEELPIPTLSLQPSTQAMTASEAATVDIFYAGNGASVDGFQFIVTLDGTAQPEITDADPSATGLQIEAIPSGDLTVATNNVTTQNGKHIIRFGMITKDATQPFISQETTRIARINLMPTQSGTVNVEFNPQNTRVNVFNSNEEVLMAFKDASFAVAQGGQALGEQAQGGETLASDASTDSSASSSSALLAKAASTPMPDPKAMESADTLASATPIPSPTPQLIAQATSSPHPQVLASTTSADLEDSFYTSTASSQTATATPRSVMKTSTASTTAALPVSGSAETTLLLLVGGLLLLGMGFYIMGGREI